MSTSTPAADLPALEPTAADLAALEWNSWESVQQLIEELLAEQAEVTDLRDRGSSASVRRLPVAHTAEPIDLDRDWSAAA